MFNSIIDKDSYRIRVLEDTDEIWDWVSANVETKTWGKLIGLTSNSATYCFKYEQDASMFALKWAGK